MISFKNLAIRRGKTVLFDGANVQIHKRWKIGLTGRNGTGKSSVMALLMGQLHADVGECAVPNDYIIAHVAQETPGLEQVAIEFVIDGDAELRQLQQAITDAERREDGTRLGSLHADFETIGGYTATARAARLLDGLGFHDGDAERSVDEFSGGFRMRLNLARALMCRSDLLLLDEPTNHLDLDAVLWLEQWLKDYRGTLILISHDRDFLDNTIGHVMHIESGRLHMYSGNYSDYERQHAAELARQSAMQAKQQREKRHMQSFVDRFRAKATKARQAQSRLKALERMQEIAIAHVDAPFSFAFFEPKFIPNPLLTLEQVDAGYADKTVLKNIKLSIQPGTRIGLIGPNGAGKSTLIRLMSGDQQPMSGKRCGSKGLAVGYFAQHTLELIDAEASPLQHVLRIEPLALEQKIRDFLGGFGFNGDQATETCAGFSGGEKARLVLALLVWQKPNLLLLDEPTNHLDLEMRHTLTLALQEYEGAMIVVSHDRHLLRAVTDELWLVADGKAAAFDGDLDDYRSWLQKHRSEQSVKQSSISKTTKPAPDKKVARQQAAEVRRMRQPLVNRIKKLETMLGLLSQQRDDIEQALAAPELYEEQNREKLKDSMQQQIVIVKELEQIETEWFEATEKLENQNE